MAKPQNLISMYILAQQQITTAGSSCSYKAHDLSTLQIALTLTPVFLPTAVTLFSYAILYVYC